ncbi:1-(5-phosphoribosyl)-5-((5-phosphoribosylamino)methylideneamino)imidazole-4-carboxamide isomerase [Metallosphaera tengchongensis]|uniref:1-(5-phosphoribosyl)-5-[(5-phosphoribosylamino)methylideneamino] imidazole-4-carboxamide isomerase n=1 Tax=Metallosphaera tengchongensis TaxID=1532350 RepID=A0A6N0NTM5_9CREN|nr:1-(5-phosphoribosyl)-5-((5-phosphoribosylamino)methylideneamino)imidazole-4-carboxamide isomerase [Metallosphaera tengchongensis]QKQ99534.1 1-(5-phosphoribosyl)-5-((5-phosphoribosylamino)methylideneamino)imidazole-4-carboxamide isomerase [Metallosphaera tengchongensis]
MKVVPSIDISQGKAVKRVKGREGTGLILGDPIKIARELRSFGYDAIHVVDLDAAEGKGDNTSLVVEIVKEGFDHVSVGGGIRTRERLERLISLGVTRVVMSTLPFTMVNDFMKISQGYLDKVMISVDYCGDEVLIKGWKASALSVSKALEIVSSLGVRGVIFTYVCNEGTTMGIDPQVGDYARRVPGERGYAGGIGTFEDLRLLSSMGFDFAIVGMALYTGVLRGVVDV